MDARILVGIPSPLALLLGYPAKEEEWSLPMTKRDIPDLFDLLIIGGGPAGGAAAETALRLGKKTAVVERDQLGGT